MKRFLKTALLVITAFLCVALAACTKGDETSDSGEVDISAPEEIVLYEGYKDTVTERFTLKGDIVSVTLESRYSQVAWNPAEKVLEIASGLTEGEYSVSLTASTEKGEKTKTISYAFTVEKYVFPSLLGPQSIILYEDYESFSSENFTVAGTNVSVSLVANNANGKIRWNDETKKLDIAEGLAGGNYLVTIKVENDRAEDTVSSEVIVKIKENPKIEGSARLEAVEGYDAISSESFTLKGSGVTVETAENDATGKIVWNDETKSLDVAAGLDCGVYLVVLKISDGMRVNEFEFTFVVKSLIRLTGSYEYTSGRYADGKIINPDDKVTVISGKYEGIVDTETQTYSISVPEGTNELTFTSELFQSVKTTVEATEDSTAEEVVFSHVLLEDISEKVVNPAVEVENGYAVWSKKNVAIKGAVAEEGFVLNYVLAGTSNTGWYYRGFIGVTLDNGTNHSMSFITSSGKLSLAWNNSATTYNSSTAYKNLGYADVKTEDLKVTIIYYENVYYFFLNDEYACKVSEKADLNQYAWNFSPDVLTDGIRTLSLSTVNITAIYKNISYKLGDEIAIETLKEIPVNITGEKEMTLAVGYAETYSGSFEVAACNDYTVTVTGNEKITWNEEKKSLHIAEGLTIGEYTVTITVNNGKQKDEFVFTVKIRADADIGEKWEWDFIDNPFEEE